MTMQNKIEKLKGRILAAFEPHDYCSSEIIANRLQIKDQDRFLFYRAIQELHNAGRLEYNNFNYRLNQ